MKPETLRWMERASRDLDLAQRLLASGDHEAATFHAQQAAEKALKAVLIERTGRFPKIHDLEFLAREVGLHPEVASRCAPLSAAYIAQRYPDVEGTITADRAADLLATAKEVVDWTHRTLS